MTPSIYDYRDAEIETAKRIRRERIRAVVVDFLTKGANTPIILGAGANT